MSSRSAGRSASALASVSSFFNSPSPITAVPEAKAMWPKSGPPPKAAASSENGAVTTLVSRLMITCTRIPPIEKCGSSSDPEMGRLMSISPRLFLSSATASSTGSLVAVGLSTRSPKVSWSRNRWFSACSLLSCTLYCTSIDSLPRVIG